MLGGTCYFGVLSKYNNYGNNPALIGLSMTWIYNSIILFGFAIKLLVDQDIIMSGM